MNTCTKIAYFAIRPAPSRNNKYRIMDRRDELISNGERKGTKTHKILSMNVRIGVREKNLWIIYDCLEDEILDLCMKSHLLVQ